MEQSDILGYHTGTYAMGDSVVSNMDYQTGSYAGVEAGTGKASLGMLSVAIIGLMFFYISTRGRQL